MSNAMNDQSTGNNVSSDSALTFEKVWTMFQELREETRVQWERSQAEWEKSREESRIAWERSQEESRIVRERSQAEWEKSREESRIAREKSEEESRIARKKSEAEWAKEKEEREARSRELDRRMKETDRIVSKLGNRFGELVEHMVIPNLTEKFNELGFHFTRISENLKIKEPGNPNTSTEVDIVLEDGDVVIAVEVKSKPDNKDVDDHIKRMEVLRRSADKRGDDRKYRGAIAAAIINDDVREYVIKKGFYPIEQSGDTMKISVPEGFAPRDW